MTSPFAALNWGILGQNTTVYRVRVIQSHIFGLTLYRRVPSSVYEPTT